MYKRDFTDRRWILVGMGKTKLHGRRLKLHCSSEMFRCLNHLFRVICVYMYLYCSILGRLIQLVALELLHGGPCVQTSVYPSRDLTKISLLSVTLPCSKTLVQYIVLVLNGVGQVTLHICLVILGDCYPLSYSPVNCAWV